MCLSLDCWNLVACLVLLSRLTFSKCCTKSQYTITRPRKVSSGRRPELRSGPSVDGNPFLSVAQPGTWHHSRLLIPHFQSVMKLCPSPFKKTQNPTPLHPLFHFVHSDQTLSSLMTKLPHWSLYYSPGLPKIHCQIGEQDALLKTCSMLVYICSLWIKEWGWRELPNHHSSTLLRFISNFVSSCSPLCYFSSSMNCSSVCSSIMAGKALFSSTERIPHLDEEEVFFNSTENSITHTHTHLLTCSDNIFFKEFTTKSLSAFSAQACT